jgi:DNA repair protein RadA/Sms
MPKLKALFRCQDCGQTAPKWAGQCSGCGVWNSLVEEVVAVKGAAPKSAPRPLTDFSSDVAPLVQVKAAEAERSATGIGELDRLLGGGLVAGQVLLVAGPPGIGKSTLMLHVAQSLADTGKVLYVTGEESPAQVSGRAKRMGVSNENILLQAETDLTKVLGAIEEHAPGFIILDSVQTVYHPEMSGGPGSVGQVRECASELLRAAKRAGSVLFILGHVTKEGSLAGPKVLEHLVDTVLQFDTERTRMLRVLRAQKNRFGPTSEIGIFEMNETGLREVTDASSFFLEELGGDPAPGRAISVTVEGSRPILIEVQALVTPTRYPLPRRMATGIDLNRVLTLLAALEKHLGTRFEAKDVFVNIAGGMKLKDPALDLAVCMALLSSARDAALPADTVFVGEVGLLGAVGRVPQLDERLRCAERAGFARAWVPARSLKELARAGWKGKIRASGADTLASAAASVLEKEHR